MRDLLESTTSQTAITVSQLNRRARALLEQGIARVWVEGEISNIARPASGHMYFSLKDDSAQIRAAFFRQRQRGPTIGLKNGDHVLAYGKVSLYEARGDYQLIVEQVEPAGEGALKREYDALKKKLHAEGLFDEERKQSLPALPERVGIITSPSGAAVRDVLTVLARRFPLVPVVIYPAAVQGDAAPAELLGALEAAVTRAECDVLILTRGGGSLEDLWAFNNETLARAIAAAEIPVVSAVGHEVDFTIADFVADVRAPTPSGAAEIVVPDQYEVQRTLGQYGARIARLGERIVEEKSQSLDWLSRRLVAGSPANMLRRQRERLASLGNELGATMRQQVMERGRTLATLERLLVQASPALKVERSLARAAQLRQRLASTSHELLADRRHRLELAMRALNSVSPLATLERGYAIVIDSDSGKALTDAAEVETGTRIEARLARGRLEATVEKTFADPD